MPTSVSPSDKAIDNTATREHLRAGRKIIMLLTVIPGVMVTGTLTVVLRAAAAEVHCSGVVLVDNWASTVCQVDSGQVRLRAECERFPDLYSHWKGRGKRTLNAGRCPLGIRGGIVEIRN
jgi:hypothetical protein